MDNPTEAITWLKTNNNLNPLATNKFENKEKALAFVEKLYNLGAKEVIVENIMSEEARIQKEGGPYADSLKVKLPQDAEKRKTLFDFINSEIEEPDLQQQDTNQQELTLWWD